MIDTLSAEATNQQTCRSSVDIEVVQRAAPLTAVGPAQYRPPELLTFDKTCDTGECRLDERRQT